MSRPGEAFGHRQAIFLAVTTVVLLMGLQSYFLASAPIAEQDAAATRDWFISNQRGVRIGVWAATLAIIPSVWLAALLRGRLPGGYRDMYFLGAASTIAATSVQAWFWGGLALHPERAPPEILRALLDVAIYFGPVLTGTMVATVAPVTWLAIQRRAGLPKGLGWLGVVVIGEQLTETLTVFGYDGFLAPGGPMNMQLGASLVLLWTLVFAGSVAFSDQAGNSDPI